MKTTIELPEPGVPFTCKLLLLAALQEADKGNCIVERLTRSGAWVQSQDLKTEEMYLQHNDMFRIQPPPPFQYKAETTVFSPGTRGRLELNDWIENQYNNAYSNACNKKLACKVEITFNEVVETPKTPKLKSTVRRK